MSLERRTQALLDLIEADRRQRCEALLREAESQVLAIVAQARAQARAQLRQAHDEERQRSHEQLASAQAALATRTRLHAQRRTEALLAQGGSLLPQALQRRWADAAARRRWIEAAIAAAMDRLPPQGWRLVHAENWPEVERQACLDALAARLGHRPDTVEDERIAAGLRIAAGGNVVDATLAGLLADRDEIGGRLVAVLGARKERTE